jgi:hypothetical protein
MTAMLAQEVQPGRLQARLNRPSRGSSSVEQGGARVNDKGRDGRKAACWQPVRQTLELVRTRDRSRRGEIVLHCFGGAGTTLIAAASAATANASTS